MLEKILSVIAPHHCVGCGRESDLLCFDCHSQMIEDIEPSCIVCRSPSALSWLCDICKKRSLIDQVWIAADYKDDLKRLIHAYKFERAKNAHRQLVRLLNDSVPQLFTTTIVVNIPTISPHIRQRGYDHAALLAKDLAKMRKLPYSPLLLRKHNHRQVGANRAVRMRQAEDMFTAAGSVPLSTPILLIDDVITTGATVTAAARVLKEAGAQQVFVAACAYEKLQQ